MKHTESTPKPRLTGTVADHETLLLSELARRFGWQRHAIRQAKRKRLRVVRFGSKNYVTGRAFREFLEAVER